MTHKMPLNLSVFLNAVRLLAGFFVVLLSAQTLFGLPLFPANCRFGNETAILFFVISGFLTRYTSQENKIDRRTFVVMRASKIYSAAFTVILICSLIDYLGSTARPAAYTAFGLDGTYSAPDLFNLMRYLTFTPESWAGHFQLGTMATYWMLAYIVMFYVFYGFTAFQTRPPYVLMAVWFLIAGPKIALYLSTWLLGMAAYDFIRKYRFGLSLALALGLFIFSLVAFVAAMVFAGPAINFSMTSPANIQVIGLSYLYHLAIAIIVALNLIGVERLIRYLPPVSAAMATTVEWLSQANLTVFLLHPTLMAAAVAFYPPLTRDPLKAALATIAVVMACLLMAEFGERRRLRFQGFFEKLFS